MNRKSFALITGASCGIGAAIAEECASRGMNLVLAALPKTGLQSVADSLQQQYHIEVIVAEGDLTQPAFLNELQSIIADHRIKLDLLVNNAGIGYEGEFELLSTEFCNSVIYLNMQAMVLLCKMFIPYLRGDKKSFILNVSSLASFSPMPYKALYSASKTFVYSFSRALRSELMESSISVSVLCPGPVPTNARVKESIRNHGFMGRFISQSAERIAKVAVAGTLSGKPVIIPGFYNRACMYLMSMIPDNLKLPLLSMNYNHVRTSISH